MSPRPLYYIVAPTGAPNYGDELIAATWLSHLAGLAPDADVVLDCLNPVGIAEPVRRAHPRLRPTTALWPLCFRHWELGADNAVPIETIVRDPSKSTVDIDDLLHSLELLRRADVVHILGGGFLNRIWPGFAGLLAGAATAAQVSGGTAAMTGQGLVPVVDGRREQYAELLGRFDVVDVRDTPSAEFAGPGATCSGDDVFLSPVPGSGWDHVPEMMVSVQSQLSGLATADVVDLVAKTAAEWATTDIGLLECVPGEDRELLELVERAVPTARRFPVHETLARGLPVAPGQCWLSTRFHPHLVAAVGGAAGVAVNINGDYYGTKHRSLIERGSGWTLLDTPSVPPRPQGGGFTADALAALRAGKRAVADRIYLSRS
jgi:polysaccharide pyruvyl transferase WcaK-like protein